MKHTNGRKKKHQPNYVTIYKTWLYNLTYILKLPIYRYSSRLLLNKLDVTSKFKAGNYILNNSQKSILLFMKHIFCWFDEGNLIIDATSGTWTMAVSNICYCVILCYKKMLTIETMFNRLLYHGCHTI
jgi:hypothetical protein